MLTLPATLYEENLPTSFRCKVLALAAGGLCYAPCDSSQIAGVAMCCTDQALHVWTPKGSGFDLNMGRALCHRYRRQRRLANAAKSEFCRRLVPCSERPVV